MSLLGDLWRVCERPQLYARILTKAITSGGALDLLKSRFPFYFSDPTVPRSVGLELTNACNLRCPYCSAQTNAVKGKTGFMSDRTFSRLLSHLRQFRLHMLRVVGGGEPTLHPRYAEFATRLRGSANIVSLTTNGQLFSERNVSQTVCAFDIVEISVDGKEAKEYEQNRVGGSYQKLLRNIDLLRSAAARHRSRMLLHIRIMFKPRDRERVKELRGFWQRYGDAVSVQPLIERAGMVTDLYRAEAKPIFRQCEYPFKAMGISWNGDVPLCSVVEEVLRTSDGGLVLGNVNKEPLLKIWRGDLLRQYRKAHRNGCPSKAPCCGNCPEPWGRTNPAGWYT
jgi:MoaA/NifB/PqqE/SkfB family radical SAM enzyme